MENILKREPELDQRDFDEIKYNLNNSSDFDSMEIEEDIKSTITINDHPLTERSHINVDNDDLLDIKKESVIDFSSEIILPQASQSQNTVPQKVKKEIKSKKEIEEEEREKMQ